MVTATPSVTVPEYPKIETLFVRDEKFKVTDELRLPEFGIPRTWHVTEKVDGTNIRVCFDQSEPLFPRVSIHGRTDAAQIPPFLFERLNILFHYSRFADVYGPDDFQRIVLYGEGYGARIQKGGGNYMRVTEENPHGVDFRLFDVLVTNKHGRDWWLNWAGVVETAAKLRVNTVPVLHLAADLMGIIEPVRAGIPSVVSREDSQQEYVSEGIVARTDPYLYTSRGQRLMFKLKTKDF